MSECKARQPFATTLAALALVALTQLPEPQRQGFRTLNDTFSPPHFTSLEEWNRRAAYLREHILVSAGLVPMPERSPLNPVIFGEIKHADYTVSKVYFESLPGFLVTGNLYRPVGNGPFPAILSPHGHWAYGRLENTPILSAPGRAINLARQGFVVFLYDMIGYNDSRQLTHTFEGPRENLWGMNLAGLQLWNAIRGLDFLQQLPYVRRDELGVTGESGGGTQTFLVSAVDERVAVSAPVNMISLHMQGGDLCENPPGLRLDTNNVEIAATIAPRPLLMVSATGDWTANTLEQEYPAVRSIYSLFNASDHVFGVRFEAPHNYNQDSREAMYAWMARWLQHGQAVAKIAERPFTVDPPNDVLVFFQRPLPQNAKTAAELTGDWIDAAKRQWQSTPIDTLARALRHVLGFGDEIVARPAPLARSDRSRIVLLSAADAGLELELRKAGFLPRIVSFTPFDTEAASKIRHFDTYNRTQASQRVADIVAALKANPGAAFVAQGNAALAGVLAAAVVPDRTMILDVDAFDTSNDAGFVDRLYIPGLRRVGDLTTAARVGGSRLVIHDVGAAFKLEGIQTLREKLSTREIVERLKKQGQ
jgi:dienelactone hydrolase